MTRADIRLKWDSCTDDSDTTTVRLEMALSFFLSLLYIVNEATCFLVYACNERLKLDFNKFTNKQVYSVSTYLIDEIFPMSKCLPF